MGRPGYPIVYQDHMRVVIAGDAAKGESPRVGINRIEDATVPLTMTLDEAREVRDALAWALMEYDAFIGQESFWHPRPDARRWTRKPKPTEPISEDVK